ncbi:MAG TPA: class I SAM-dependent methyltransferase [Longilinea sp.]|nr:class I SAM-dependent methyltransferase [Longilinea sp.]
MPMLFNCPLSVSKAVRIIEQFDLKPHSQVLDAGCGDGEFLTRVAERYQINGFGFDLNQSLIEKAHAKANSRVKSGKVVFKAQAAADFSAQTGFYDLIICIGSEFIFGGYEGALKTLKPYLSKNGLLLIGTIFWKKEPLEEYLQLMDGENPYFDHAATVDKAVQNGFIPLYVCRSNADEWDDFESSVSRRKYLEILDQPANAETTEKIEKIRMWQSGYIRWGIDTMGFGFYLLRKA